MAAQKAKPLPGSRSMASKVERVRACVFCWRGNAVKIHTFAICFVRSFHEHAKVWLNNKRIPSVPAVRSRIASAMDSQLMGYISYLYKRQDLKLNWRPL